MRRRRAFMLRMLYYLLSSYGAQAVFFVVECGIARFLCAMRMLCAYSTFGHQSHPYPCAKFRFFRTIHIAELARGEKSRTRSLIHSPSLFDGPRTEAFASENLASAIHSLNNADHASRGL